jgi:molecular chaperone HtpG
VLKEGILREPDRRDAILDLCLFETTADLGSAEPVNLDDAPTAVDEVADQDPKITDAPPFAPRTTVDGYLERMTATQEAIYVLAGPDLATLKKSPHLEAFRDRNIEVLLLPDPVDEWWAAQVDKIRDKPLRQVGKGEIELGSEEERKAEKDKRDQAQAELEPVLKTLGEHLGQHIREVRVSTRLKDSAACLVGNPWDLSPQMEAALRASGRDVPPSKRVLEVNPDHPALSRLKAIHALSPSDERLREAAILLHGQALLAEGAAPPDPAEFARTLGKALEKALG